MNDVAFHYVFGRESRKYNLLNLLNAILVKAELPLDLSCPLTRWSLFLSDQTDQKMKEAILMQDKNIQNAYEDLEKLAADKDARRLYEIRENSARDLRSHLYEAEQRGLEKGLQQGQQERILLILKMLEEGLDEGLIKKIAGLTQEQLNEIKAQSPPYSRSRLEGKKREQGHLALPVSLLIS